jgi:hypothetical protein
MIDTSSDSDSADNKTLPATAPEEIKRGALD